MDILQLLCIVSVAFTGLTSGSGVLPDGPLTAAEGGTVMFNTTVTPPVKPFVAVTWTCTHNNIEKTIITSTSTDVIEPEYNGRITFFRSTGSLELRNLALNDSGEYRVTIIPDGGAQSTGQTRLEVLVPVSSATVTVSDTDLVEFNSSFSLSCSSSGSSLSFLWLNGSSEVTASDRVQLTDEGRNLTIINVTRYDPGSFTCKVSNAVSETTSNPVNFSISYGPDEIHFKKSPSQEHYVIGSNIDLSCSTVSSPPAQFTWFLNGSLLSDTGPELRLRDVQESQSGSYSCQAFNSKTLRYQTSQPSAIIVLMAVSSVRVTASGTDLVEFNSSVSLSCSSSGSSLSFLWLNGSSEVTVSDRVQLTDEGSTLTMVNVTRHDQGPFRCHVFNPVNNDTSDPENLSISFGPENIILKLSSSKEYVEGSSITLTCSAVSRPAALFYWLLNGSLLSDTGPELSLMNIQMNQSGNYSCQAFNSKTLRYQTSQPSAVTVLGQQPLAGCSAGCIAGIVIACCVVATACAVAVYYIYKKKKQGKQSSNRGTATRTGGEGQNNAASAQRQELNYADLSFVQNKGGGAVQMDLENNSTQYAQIRVDSPPAAASSPPTYDAHMQRSKTQAPQPGANVADMYAQVHKK